MSRKRLSCAYAVPLQNIKNGLEAIVRPKRLYYECHSQTQSRIMAAPTSPEICKAARKFYMQCASFNKAAKQAGITDQVIRRIARRERWEILPKPKNSRYSEETKKEAIAAYVATGSIMQAAHIVNVPDQTLTVWTKEGWCIELLKELRESKKTQLDAGMTQVIDLAMEATKDRLSNGEDSTQWDAEAGRFRPRKMTGQSCATTLAIMYDKRALLRGEGQAAAQGVDALKLAEAFRAIATDAKVAGATQNTAIDITPETDDS